MGEKGVETSTPEAGVSGTGTSSGPNFDEQAHVDLTQAHLEAVANQILLDGGHVGPGEFDTVAKTIPGTDAGAGADAGGGTRSGGTSETSGGSSTSGTDDPLPGGSRSA